MVHLLHTSNIMHHHDIKTAIQHPEELERLYRTDREGFHQSFLKAYEEIKGNALAEFWKIRLEYAGQSIARVAAGFTDISYLIIGAILGILLVQIPNFVEVDPEFYYPRYLSFFFFPAAIFYFAVSRGVSTRLLILFGAFILFSLIVISLWPHKPDADSIILSQLHMPLLMWMLLGFAYTAKDLKSPELRLKYLRFNADLLVMSVLILLAGALLTGLTIGLYAAVGIQIEEFYFKYIAVSGLVAAPTVATFLVVTRPQLVNKISPVIATVFSPLALIMLIMFVLGLIFQAENPLHNRDFLIVFNGVLIGAMALILFNMVEIKRVEFRSFRTWMVAGLLLVCIVINAMALVAIITRLSEWGLTPNRLAVLGSNLLIFIHLLLVAMAMVKSGKNQGNKESITNSIASFLPVYGMWILIVVFLFPLLFGMQ